MKTILRKTEMKRISRFLSGVLIAGLALHCGGGGIGGTGSVSGFGSVWVNGIEWFTEERIRELCRETVERTMILFEARRPPAGEMPVVLAAGASGILLHEAIGHGMEADFNRKGVSIYSTMIDQKVANDEVTIVDSALLPGERGALNVDDEGNETEETVLVDAGEEAHVAAHHAVPACRRVGCACFPRSP